jgi:hypothetical protein
LPKNWSKRSPLNARLLSTAALPGYYDFIGAEMS